VQRVVAGDRLDPAHAGGDAAFGGDAEEADVAGADDVGAAAQFARGADVETRTSSPYFSPKSIMAPEFLGFGDGQHAGFGGRVGEDLGIDDVLDRRISASVIGWLCTKSKRVLSGSTCDPFCCT
jgi:hypothetical protein